MFLYLIWRYLNLSSKKHGLFNYLCDHKVYQRSTNEDLHSIITEWMVPPNLKERTQSRNLLLNVIKNEIIEYYLYYIEHLYFNIMPLFWKAED